MPRFNMVRKLLLPFLFFTISFFSFAQTFTDSTPAGTKTWTVPNGVTSITLEIWGAGGAGGGSLINKEGGAGGGGGAYVLRTITVTPGDIITYSVGTGAIGTSNAGTTGGNTTLTTVSGTNLNANGGSGGNTAVHNASVSAGSGGSASGGTTNTNGSNGSNNSTSTGNGGKGGNGGNGGAGGTGADGNNGGNGVEGANPGGGGGGGVLKGSSFGIGGNGGNGQVRISYCTAGILSGNQYLCTYSPASTTFTSTVSGGTWSTNNSAIAAINSSTGVITTPAGANGTATITYTVPATGSCPIQTATRTLYATNTQPTTPNTPSGSSSVCQGTTAIYTVNSIPNVTYNWVYTGTGATITPAANGLSATVSFSSTAGNFGRVEVSTTNGCGTSGASGLNVFVSQLSNGGTITADKSTGCAGDTYITRLQLSGYIGLPIRWESSTDNFVSNIVSINNTNNGMNIENLTQTTSYRAVVQNSPCTAAAYSNIFKITIGSTAPYTVSTASSSPNVCIHSAITPVTHTTTVATGIENNGVSGANGLPPGVSATWSSDVITISGTPTSAVGSPFNYSIRLTGCSSTNAYATGTITVRTNTVTASSNPIICLGAGITITHTTTGVTGIGTITGLPAGVIANWNADTITISGTPTATGSFPYTIQLTGGCGAINATGTIKVNPTLVPSVTITHDQPSLTICQGTHVRFTAHPINGGTTPIYKWYNGSTLLTETSNSYLAYNVVSTDAIRVEMISNATPCLSTTAAVPSNTISFSVITTDRGRTQGGGQICKGTVTPKFKLVNFDNPGQGSPYSYSQKVLRWEYSTDGNVTWSPIQGTQGLIEYQPTATDPLYILTVNTTFRAVTQTSGCTTEYYAIETGVELKPVPTVTFTSQAGTDSCIGTDVTYTTQPNQTNYAWTVTGALGTDYNIAGGSLSNTSNTVTIKWLTSGNKTVTVNYSNGNPNNCSAITPTSSTTYVNPAPIAPIIVSKVLPTCTVPTGSVNLSGLPATGIVRYLAKNSTTATYTITGTTMTISGLAPGKYKFATDNPCGTIYSDEIDISGNTWDGTSWSAGNADPTLNDVLIFAADYNVNKDVNGCSCTVTNNAKVTIKKGKTMTITNFVNIDSGSLTFEDTASLLQTNTDPNINTGSIEYVRTTLPIRQADYVYWSTPVKGQTLAAVSPLTESNKYFRFDGTGWVATPKTNVMIVGKGYIIRGPEGTSNTVRAPYTATFRGTPNNGTVTSETYDSGKNYLIGNPYPSAIDADKFLSDLNNKGLLQGTLYFWTHNTPVTLGGYYRYNADDYASYNLSGGTKTMKEAKTANNAPGNINSAPQGYIAAGQSFMAGFSFPGQIQFTNSMRIGADKNAQFFKPGKTSKTTGIEKNRVWLNLTNEEGAFKQMLVGYIEGASNDYDRGYDGLSFDGNKYIDFYSIGGTRKFVIQGRALPFTDTDIVPLGYKTTIAGDFTISIDQADGIFTTQSIYLEDKTTGKIQDLRAANYTFTTAIGTFADRFVLRYTNKTLGTGDFENVENGLLVAVKDKTIKVTSAKETIKEVAIFDINGKLLYNKKKVGSTELQIANLQSANQVLLVKVTLENDYAVTKKIIFQ
ncbi:T9SS sorting signal type C domain-containing protein [Flavobacterium sp. MDT1-60]|uniref:glycine-rich domain-containing protein n=1 Tax=Flavobacterium sp. MDT1-60 TaxID=1979344 RepID=UPI00177F4353|nr:T9SS sorting signal type C domain-containing protein [Flavobacterium sp. MDT1-60]QOG03324.1 T9SS type A sorting domain-containing protein [Flavobacterium sp. MDT1-60]